MFSVLLITEKLIHYMSAFNYCSGAVPGAAVQVAQSPMHPHLHDGQARAREEEEAGPIIKILL